MGAATLQTPTTGRKIFTPEEYLARERAAAFRSEYDEGDIFPMAGASRKHNLITANIARELGNALAETDCEIYASDMRVKIPNSTLYSYPDVVVACDEPKFEDNEQDTLLNPCLIVEVLSSSTAAQDRGRKYRQYQTISSLREYALVSQTERLVEAFALQKDGKWAKTGEAKGAETLPLASVTVKLSLEKVYAKVTLP